MTGKHILVTGGAGFIGSALVKHLLSAYPTVKVTNFDALTYAGNLNNLKEVEADKRYTFIKGDIRLADDVNQAFEENHFDYIFHLAAESHVDRSILGPQAFIETNILGTSQLLQAFKEQVEGGKNCRFVHVSTDEVYGSLGAEGKFQPDSPYDPRSPYSASKAASDHIVKAFYHTYGLDVVVTNCSNNYGPYQFPEKLIPLVIHRCKHELEIPVYGKGDNIRDWIHVNDHVKGLVSSALEGKSGETYLIGSDNEWTNLDLVHTLCSLVDHQLERPEGSSAKLIRFVEDRAGHDKRYAIDSSKLKEETGWEAAVSFDQGLRDTVQWYLSNDRWLEDVTSGQYMSYYAEQYSHR